MAVSKPLLGCIADDFTGATDLANMLVREGMRTIQTIGVCASPVCNVDAIVVALKSRTIAPQDAIEQSLGALAWLKEQGCTQFFFKYCSTFDSTDTGNIGPVADALLQALSADFTIACPAFPENGRTVYQGHLFVNDALLNESGMQNHPLTPMRDANLIRVLQRQTPSKVGLIDANTVKQGVDAIRSRIASLRKDGVRMAIADAIANDDLYALGAACRDLTLITGGSGIALGLPGNFVRNGTLNPGDSSECLPAIVGHGVVLAGSASVATNAQVSHWKVSRPAFRIDPIALSKGENIVEQALDFVRRHAPQIALVYATTAPDEVRAVQAALGVQRSGQLVEQALATVARRLFDEGMRHFVVAGGETSGAVVQALDVRALRIGPQIDPGVPATVAIDETGEPRVALALKSGNFGAVDFFEKALKALGAQLS